ncbi:MAG: endonuclease domain-containing protein [Oscillospiraceae bacterium]
MSLPYNHAKIPFAKELRKNATPQEKHLWYDFLNTYQVRFQRQKTIGGYIADFYCSKASLIIELDGSQHYTNDGMEYDAIRTSVLEQYGLEVIRFSNSDVDKNFNGVCVMIDEKVKEKLKNKCQD